MQNIDLITLAVQALSGIIGANILGVILGRLNLGFLGNSVAGLLGGGLFTSLISGHLGLPVPQLNIDTQIDPIVIANQIVAGAASGAIVMLTLGLLRAAFQCGWCGRCAQR